MAAIGGLAVGALCPRLIGSFGTDRIAAAAVVTRAVSQLGLGLTGTLPLAGVLLALSSGAFTAFNITAMAARQRGVPPHLLGRVTSSYLTVARGAETIGSLLGGILAAWAGVRAPMLAGVVPLLVTALLFCRRHDATAAGHPVQP